VHYVRFAKRSAKAKGIQLLIRVLRELREAPLAGPAAQVNLDAVMGLRRVMESMYLKERCAISLCSFVPRIFLLINFYVLEQM
jgi:hypothetical protein